MTIKLAALSGIFHPESGGPATYLHKMLPELQAQDFDVRLITYGEGSLNYGYPVKRVPRRALPLRLTEYAMAARSLLSWANLAYIHSFDLPLLGKRIPRVMKVVGDPAWERAVRKGWITPEEDFDIFQIKRYNAAINGQRVSRDRQIDTMDAVIVPSEYLKRLVIGWGMAEHRIHVIYNAVETLPIEATQFETRAQLGLTGDPLLLTVARLTPWKGVDHVISALRELPDVRLIVIGDGPMEGALRAQAAQVGLSDRVQFLGRVANHQVAQYMRAADYTILYSGYEGLSHTLLESLQNGTPVIASDKGGNPEVVQHGVNGLLVPYVNVEALIAAIREAFTVGKRAELAANNSIGMERFQFARMVEDTAVVLKGYSKT